MSAEGVDQNIDLALKSFYSEANVQESTSLLILSVPPTHRDLELHMLWSVHIPCWSSLSLATVCMSSMFRKAFLSFTVSLCILERGRRKTGVAGAENSPHFFTALVKSNGVFDRDYCATGMLVLDKSVVVCMCAHMFLVCGCVFRRVAGKCSGAHQPIIAHNCIHLWKRQR